MDLVENDWKQQKPLWNRQVRRKGRKTKIIKQDASLLADKHPQAAEPTTHAPPPATITPTALKIECHK